MVLAQMLVDSVVLEGRSVRDTARSCGVSKSWIRSQANDLPSMVASMFQTPSRTEIPVTPARLAGSGVVMARDEIRPPSGRPEGLGQSFQSMKNKGVEVNSRSQSR